MGCVFGKPAVKEDREVYRGLGLPRVVRHDTRDLIVGLNGSRKVEHVDLEKNIVRNGGVVNGSRKVRDDDLGENEENLGVFVGVVPKAMEGEQVAAGWPSWLAAVAGEAINEWLPRSADTFEKLDKIGQGTYSSVFKARDLIHKKVVALKRVRFDTMDSESIKFMAREILILRRLDHPNIIKLEGLIISHSCSSLYLVFEYMEHDLTGIASLPGVKFTEPQIKCYMHQLLSGLDHCHSRGVLHRDIKGSNLLIDNSGNLKIADFGLANFFDHSQSMTLTSRVVTLWYRPPELLLGSTYYGVEVDLWSTGCILGELYAGKPIMPGRTEIEQIHKIFKLCGSPSEEYWKKSELPNTTIYKPLKPYKRRLAETFKDFPSTAIKLMETLLAVDPECRRSAAFALESEFFTEEPHACDPSSLPKYPPSKEIDAKLRTEDAKRNGAVGVGGGRFDCDIRRSKESLRGPAPDANAELITSIKKRQLCTNSKSQSEVFDFKQEEAASGFPIVPLSPDKICLSDSQVLNPVGRLSESREKLGPSRKHHMHNSRKLFGSRQTQGGRSSLNELTLGNKILFTGPLLVVQKNNMVKDQDRHTQETSRRARLEKARQELDIFRMKGHK